MSFSRGFMRLALMFEHFSRTKRAQKTHSTPTKIIKNLQPKKSAKIPLAALPTSPPMMVTPIYAPIAAATYLLGVLTEM